MISLKHTTLIALLFSNLIITDSSCSSTERTHLIGCFLVGATVIGCVALLIKTERECHAVEQEAQHSLDNTSSEATTRMKAADRRLAEQIARNAATNERIQQAQEAHRRGEREQAREALRSILIEELNPRMQ